LYCVNVNCDSAITSTALESRLKRRLPDGSHIYGNIFTRRDKNAIILVGIPAQDWKEWVLEGFGIPVDDQSDQLAEQLWKTQGTNLFRGAAESDLEWDSPKWAAISKEKQSPWAVNEPYTPQHFFRHSKFDEEHGELNKWYDGPREEEEFLFEMEFYILSFSTENLFGQRF
jgi:hypothetical protein